MKKKVIVDFDNTFSLEGCDLDDIVALLYLLTSEKVEVPFVCTTFGNSTLDNVNKCTEDFFKLVGINLKIYSGNKDPNHSSEISVADAKTNKAANAMIQCIEEYPNEVHLLALGSLHNFADAFALAPKTISKVKSFTAMGGTTAPLIFNKTEMNELNFSIDYNASKVVLKNFPCPNIITGNNCIKHIYTLDDFKVIPKTKIINILYEVIEKWFYFFKNKFDFTGNVLWDVFASMYITEPELFLDEFNEYELSSEQLKTGCLVSTSSGTKLNLPKLKNADNIYKKVFEQISTFKC